MNMQGWFPLGWTGLISLLFKGLSRVFSSTTIQNHQFLSPVPSLLSNSHILGVTTGTAITLTILTFVRKVISLLFNSLSRFVKLSCQEAVTNFMAAVTIHSDFRIQEQEICHYYYLFTLYFARKWWDSMPWSFFFFKHCVLSRLFHSPLSPSSRDALVPLSFLPLR